MEEEFRMPSPSTSHNISSGFSQELCTTACFSGVCLLRRVCLCSSSCPGACYINQLASDSEILLNLPLEWWDLRCTPLASSLKFFVSFYLIVQVALLLGVDWGAVRIFFWDSFNLLKTCTHMLIAIWSLRRSLAIQRCSLYELLQFFLFVPGV